MGSERELSPAVIADRLQRSLDKTDPVTTPDITVSRGGVMNIIRALRAAPEPPCDAAVEAACARIETELSLAGNEPESDPSFVADLRTLIAYARATPPPASEPSAEPAAYRVDWTAGTVEVFGFTSPGALRMYVRELRDDGMLNIRETPLYRHAQPPGRDELIEHAIKQLDDFSDLTNRVWPTLHTLRNRLAASRPTKGCDAG
jgi:hypothetical protein